MLGALTIATPGVTGWSICAATGDAMDIDIPVGSPPLIGGLPDESSPMGGGKLVGSTPMIGGLPRLITGFPPMTGGIP